MRRVPHPTSLSYQLLLALPSPPYVAAGRRSSMPDRLVNKSATAIKPLQTITYLPQFILSADFTGRISHFSTISTAAPIKRANPSSATIMTRATNSESSPLGSISSVFHLENQFLTTVVTRSQRLVGGGWSIDVDDLIGISKVGLSSFKVSGPLCLHFLHSC
jgi:hypothetical protein